MEEKNLIDLNIDNGFSFKNVIQTLDSLKRKYIPFCFKKDEITIITPIEIEGILVIAHISLDTSKISTENYEYNFPCEKKIFNIDISQLAKSISTIKKANGIRIFFKNEDSFYVQKIVSNSKRNEQENGVATRCDISINNKNDDSFSFIDEFELENYESVFKSYKNNCRITPEQFSEQIKITKNNNASYIQICGIPGKNFAIFKSFTSDKETVKNFIKFGSEDIKGRLVKNGENLQIQSCDEQVKFKINILFFTALSKLPNAIDKKSHIRICFSPEDLKIEMQTECIFIKFFFKKKED